MPAEKITAPFIFVVDTNLYAGNFEREMCGYVTGTYGECGVGIEEAECFVKSLNQAGQDGAALQEAFAAIISQEPDDSDHPCYRPAGIWPTPGRWNNGQGQHFDDADFDAKKSWQGRAWPAYESVAIFFQERPTPDQLALMAQRIQLFAERHNRGEGRMQFGKAPADDKRMTIKGVRLLQRTLAETVVELPLQA
jgi:hypothetical protein